MGTASTNASQNQGAADRNNGGSGRSTYGQSDAIAKAYQTGWNQAGQSGNTNKR
jgi:hypothetical protein